MARAPWSGRYTRKTEGPRRLGLSPTDSPHAPAPSSQLVGGETSSERTTQILVKQPVKQVLASLSAYRQPPRGIGSRGQAPLNGIANGHVLVLHLLTHRDALPMMLCGSGAEI